MRVVFDDALISGVADKIIKLQSRENTAIPLLKQQLAETEKGIENVLNAIQQGIFTASTKKRLDDLEEAKSKLEVCILQEEIKKPLLTKEQVLFWLHRFREFDVSNTDHRQRLVDSFVNAIYLYDDKIVLTFNYKEGSKTISLNDIDCSSLSASGAPEKPLENANSLSGFSFCLIHTACK